MSNTAFDAFLSEVLPWATACPYPVAISAIRNTCIDLCSQTNVWQETLDPQQVNQANLPLDLDGPSGAMVIQVLSCKADGVSLSPVTIDYLDDRHPNWEEVTGTPSVYFKPNTAQLSLYPLPVQDVSLRLRVSYAPTRASTTVDSAIYDNNLTLIAAGAIARLMLIPGVAWSDPKLALYYANIYASGVTEVLNDTQKSFSRARNRVRSNPF